MSVSRHIANSKASTRPRPVSLRTHLCLALLLACAAPSGPAAQTPAPPPVAPRLVLAIEAHVRLGTPVEVGQVPRGRRRIIPIVGGTFEGSGIRGKVLNNGADWQVIRADGFAELDTRYALETDKGEIIYVQNAGMRHAAPEIMQKLLAGEVVDPKAVYFRTVANFETSATALQWLTRSIFVGTGERYPTEVVIRFWRLE
jgi:uncharacterized protein DUF3237